MVRAPYCPPAFLLFSNGGEGKGALGTHTWMNGCKHCHFVAYWKIDSQLSFICTYSCLQVGLSLFTMYKYLSYSDLLSQQLSQPAHWHHRLWLCLMWLPFPSLCLSWGFCSGWSSSEWLLCDIGVYLSQYHMPTSHGVWTGGAADSKISWQQFPRAMLPKLQLCRYMNVHVCSSY